MHEVEIKQINPNERWVEQDPIEILNAIRICTTQAIKKLDQITPCLYTKNDIITIGITNQRETIVVWDKFTGKPLYNAIGDYMMLMINNEKKNFRFNSVFNVYYFFFFLVWNDARTEETVEEVLNGIPGRNPYHFQNISGLQISPYFSALKIKWLQDNVPEVKAAFAAKTCLVGTIDSWLVWVCIFPWKILSDKLKFKQIFNFVEFNWWTKRWTACN